MDQNTPGYQSVLSELVSAIVGRGWFYYVTMASVLAVLCLSANTSFVDFPRLCRLIAKDEFLPVYFAAIGRRLVYSTGVLFLAAAAGLLIVGFKGITDDLIPLYAVGAFLAFTLSQSGMVIHWRKKLGGSSPTAGSAGPRKTGIRVRQAVNGVGAVATGCALVIILVAKFTEGAWITLLTIPVLLTIFKIVHRHYRLVEALIQCDHPLDLSDNAAPVVLVPVRGWTKPLNKALRFAIHLSPDVVGVHLSNLEGDAADDESQQMRKEWTQRVEAPAVAAGVPMPKLELVQTPYREFVRPMLEQIDRAIERCPRRLIVVVLPELIEKNWLESMLHLHRAMHLRMALRKRKDSRVVVIDLPWFIDFLHCTADQPDDQASGSVGTRVPAEEVGAAGV